MFYRGADAAVFVYDVTDQSSFTSVEDWYREMSFHCDTNDVVLALVGNKTDMVDSRVVEREKAEKLAERRHMLYREVSCVSDENLPRVTGELMVVVNRGVFAPLLPFFMREGYVRTYVRT